MSKAKILVDPDYVKIDKNIVFTIVMYSLLLFFCLGAAFLLRKQISRLYQHYAVETQETSTPQNTAKATEKVPPDYEKVLKLPPAILTQLSQMGAVIDNAYNPTQAKAHDTLLVQPNADLQYHLRPNASVNIYVLDTVKPVNIDPPTLHVDSHQPLPPTVQQYLQQHTRLSYSYHIDGNGLRTTLPAVIASKKILILGDSVAFGVGVSDEDTIASKLQQKLGNQYQVINAGVGGYQGDQILKVLDNQLKTGQFDKLIYIACQNDFINSEDNRFHPEEAERVLRGLAKYKDHFPGGILVGFQTYIEYSLRDTLLGTEPSKGPEIVSWKEGWNEQTDALRQEMASLTRRFGFAYYDWNDIVAEARQHDHTVFSGFSLYVDHCHLSPRGAALAADRIARQWKLNSDTGL